MFYYGCGMNCVPFTSNYWLASNQAVSQPVQTETQPTQKENKSSDNKDLLWAGITGLAILGTYLLTRGHYKVSNTAISRATQNATPAVTSTAKPVPQSVNTFLETYKPFSGIQNVADGITPKVTQIGSRTRAEFVTTVNGESVKEIIIFNDKGNAVSRFLETTKPNNSGCSTRIRQAFKLNANGEQELAQTSMRVRGDYTTFSKRGTRRYNATTDGIRIENYNVNQVPKDLPNGNIDPNSNIRTLQIERLYDKTSGRLVKLNNSRTYINAEGEGIYGAFRNERFFAYDKEGKLVGILEQNPQKAWGEKDYAYHTINNGKIVASRPATQHDCSVLNKGGSYSYTDGQIHHAMTDEEIAGFADYFSSRRILS